MVGSQVRSLSTRWNREERAVKTWALEVQLLKSVDVKVPKTWCVGKLKGPGPEQSMLG